MAPKSILKNKSALPSEHDGKSKEARNREIALQRATLIQEQKDIEAQIFESLLQLIDLPSNADADPASPSATDVASLKSNLEFFQQSDFDELIEERRANGKCGCVLCPKPHRKEAATGKFRIIGEQIVPRESLESWCSDACRKRAMYLKVQISDEPALFRTLSATPEITVPGVDVPEVKTQTLNLPLRPKSKETPDRLEEGMAELMLERGDKETSSRHGTVLITTVSEKDSISRPQEPDSDLQHDLIEGYKPKSKKKKAADSDDEEDDEDWDI